MQSSLFVEVDLNDFSENAWIKACVFYRILHFFPFRFLFNVCDENSVLWSLVVLVLNTIKISTKYNSVLYHFKEPHFKVLCGKDLRKKIWVHICWFFVTLI